MAVAVQGHQEGSRWINERPSGEDVAKWFITNAPMHDGMYPQRYVTGVVLIPAKEKARYAAQDGQGNVTFPEVEQLVYVPYVKVETRVAYFWDYVRSLGDGDYVGAIEPADVPRLEVEGVYNMNLPPGFFRLPVQEASGKFVHFLCCSMQVRIYAPDGAVVMAPATGTKMVSCLTRWGIDEHALMKAETGAVGRALGMAGMLVLPGSGVATAEDMQEMLAAEGRPSVGVDARLPASGEPDELVRAQILELSAQLQSEHPGRFEELEAWAREKKIDLADIKAHQLRSVLRAVERKAAGES
jgi:hypothetical protein